MGNGRDSLWAKILMWILIGGSILSVFVYLIYAII